MNHLERFLAVMEYEPVDRVPNWELGAWAQTRDRWEKEGLDPTSLHWNWFAGDAVLGMDPHTVARGRQELLGGELESAGIRKAGGGRHPQEKKRRES